MTLRGEEGTYERGWAPPGKREQGRLGAAGIGLEKQRAVGLEDWAKAWHATHVGFAPGKYVEIGTRQV